MFCNINHHIVSFRVAIRVFETLSLICNLMHLSIYDCFKFNKLRCIKTLKVQFKNTNEINNSVDIAESRYVQICDYLFYKSCHNNLCQAQGFMVIHNVVSNSPEAHLDIEESRYV